MNKLRTPRSLRNNNPLNIRRSKAQWQGMKAEQTDTGFVQFETMAYGWRAAFIILARTYYYIYRLNTPRKIIARWAPEGENDVEAYLNRVCQLSGLKRDEQLSIPAMYPSPWMKLALAMAVVEGGTEDIDPYPMLDGWQMMRDSIGAKDNRVSGPTGNMS